jgi:hypothetical protein
MSAYWWAWSQQSLPYRIKTVIQKKSYRVPVPHRFYRSKNPFLNKEKKFKVGMPTKFERATKKRNWEEIPYGIYRLFLHQYFALLFPFVLKNISSDYSTVFCIQEANFPTECWFLTLQAGHYFFSNQNYFYLRFCKANKSSGFIIFFESIVVVSFWKNAYSLL